MDKQKIILSVILFFVTISLQANSAETKKVIPSVPTSKIMVLSLTGGGEEKSTMKSFYSRAVAVHETFNTLNFEKNELLEYFGQTTSTGRQAKYFKYKDDKLENKDLISEIKKDCSKLNPLLHQILGMSEKEYVSVDQELYNQKGFKGPASKAAIEEAFKHVTSTLTKNDYLIINLSDHGAKNNLSITETSWGIQLDQPEEFITDSQLKKYISTMINNGVTVQLNVSACFSGGFNLLPFDSNFCSISTQDPHMIAIDTEFNVDIFKNLLIYGDFLQSYACELANENINLPMSNLDQIVNNWKESTKNCITNSTSTSLVQSQKELSRALLSKELKLYFKQSFLDVFDKCANHVSKRNELLENLGEVINECIKEDEKLSEDKKRLFYNQISYKKELEKLGANPFAIEAQCFYMKKSILKLLNKRDQKGKIKENIHEIEEFLNTADLDYLEKFKRALCCLGYNLKTRERPSICK
ncbi:MAG: hypothetical protein HQK51_07165 [Oligoflexia bacterium]|nr:hypothetical protein [Oligoflexia bacterium]